MLMHSTQKKQVNVAVGVIQNAQQQVLVAERKAESSLGGLWEFPGGKVEVNETVYEALCRELLEEIGILVITAEPLIQIKHDYDSYQVILHTYRVKQYQGAPKGMEQQQICWKKVAELRQLTFPAANQAIIDCLQCPPR